MIVVACTGLGVCAAESFAASTAKSASPLRDATLYSGITGTLTTDAEGKIWYFTASADVSDGLTTVPSGTPVEMLPCSTLEKIIAAAGEQRTIEGKLWARVTRYSNRNILIDKLPSHKFINRKAPNKHRLDSQFLAENLINRNFLFAIYFIPMTSEKPAGATAPGIAQPKNNESILPDEILEQMNRRRVADLKKMKEMLQTEGDVVLADRIGFVNIDDSGKTFTVDSLGRNVDDMEFTLLPCEVLEYTEQSLVDMPAIRQRFRVSGIVTTFRGRQYMLLQRAVRTYSHGNFAR